MDGFVPSLTIENYVKAIYLLTSGADSPAASTGALATALGVSPSTVTGMLKTLHDSGLAEHRPYEGASLTEQGRKLALRVIRRHRLIELFLVETLQLSWSEVHAEAEHMEHAVSDLLIDRIDAYLHFPELDPHGDPIPKRDGSVANAEYMPLSECNFEQLLQLCRVLDQSPEFLSFLSKAGLEINAQFQVIRRDAMAGTLTLRGAGCETTIGTEAASQLMVQPVALPAAD